MVEQDWLKVKIESERDVMLKRAEITRVIAICGLFMIFAALVMMFGFPCFKVIMGYVANKTAPEKSLPIRAYYLHDVSKSPQFELTLLLQAFGVFLAGFSYSGVDNLLGLLVLHICSQLENLHSRLIY